jgi:cystathionine beta-lyase/cystathionine gamma-synthase
MRFRTRAIHVGQEPDEATGAVVPPIHVATTFVLPAPGASVRYDYARSGTPNRSCLERTISSLEAGCGALAYATGMAAIHGVTLLLRPGDHLLASTDLYGGSYRLFHQVLANQGIEVTLADASRPDAFAAALRPNTRMVWVESVGNPLLSVTDIAVCASLAHQAGALLVVDNTFATPVLVRPLEWGADIVVHSATKYLGGHSDALGGLVVVSQPTLWERLYFLLNATGSVMGTLETYLIQRGIKTLDLRVREQCRTAARLAEFLTKHPAVQRVYYPGLPTHPGHDLARRQMGDGFGAMLSFEVHGGCDAARRVVTATKLFRLAVSLGAVESLIEHPATMSHASYAPEARRASGIGDNLIRLSVGLEDPQDLEDDLRQALDTLVG